MAGKEALLLVWRAEVWTPVVAKLRGLEETAGLNRALREGAHIPGLGDWGVESSSPHPVTFQVSHFSEPRCLLMSWGREAFSLLP